MIVVHIEHEGIKKVFVSASSEAEQDSDLTVWPLVRRGLNRINQQLARRETRHERPELKRAADER